MPRVDPEFIRTRIPRNLARIAAYAMLVVWAGALGGICMPNHDSSLSDARLWKKVEGIAASEGRDGSAAEFLDREEIQRVLHDEALRLQDFRGLQVMAYTLIANPHDRETQSIFCGFLLERRYFATALADDFLANYPSRLKPLPRDMIKVGVMPNGIPIGYPPERSACNVGIWGATGSGKTELEKWQILQLVERDYFVGVLERKADHANLALLPKLADRTTVLDFTDVSISLYEPPPGVPANAWADEVTKLIAGCYARLSAHRLLRDIIYKEEALKGSADDYFTLSQVIRAVDAFKPHFGKRESDYRESVLYVLKDMFHATKGIFEYRRSNCLANLFAKGGLVVINTRTLAVDHYQFLSNYLMRWPYMQRLHDPSKRALRMVWVFEDATSAVPQQRDWQNSGLVPSMVEQLLTQRSLNLGCCLVVHSLAMSAPMLANIETRGGFITLNLGLAKL